jgi:hypothetical protein
MATTKSERRSRNRVEVRLPVTVKPKDGSAEQLSYTRDLSGQGIFFYSDSKITEGSQLEMVLILPTEVTAGERKWVCCQASVVRVEVGSGKGFGVAAVFDRLDVMPEIPQ